MMDWNGHMTAGGWIASILVVTIVLVVVVAAIAWFAREVGRRRDDAPASTASAREILDRRLVDGEIDAGQYQELRQHLGGQPGAAPDAPATRSAADVPV